ncbi:MAG TPA: outer membrane beta-barrel protein [Bradyrhizobium sp.]|nr:outer membrane beta-barrel protein [Bradyrhizobium sp.]
MTRWSGVIALLALGCAAQPGSAADLAMRPVTKAPPPAVSDWSGFYIGGDIGFRSDRTDVTTDSLAFGGFPTFSTGTATSQPMDGTGVRGGIYGGYNWQFAPTWVAGVEADVGWARPSATLNGVFLPGNAFLMPGDPSASLTARSTWDAGIRGRLGYLVTPATMVYVTGGAAWLHLETSATCSVLICGTPVVSFSNSSTPVGWTVGGGVETRLWGNWLARAEYRYADFGSVTYSDVSPLGVTATYEDKVRTHTALFGLAYKFGPGWTPAGPVAPAFPTKAPAIAPVNWSGAYAGLDLGLRSSMTNATENGVTINGAAAPCVFAGFVPPRSCVSSEPMNGSAFRLGGHLGYDWQISPQWLVGIEGDAGWADRTVTFHGSALPGNINGFLFPIGSFSGLQGDSFSVKSTWDASLRGRVGVLATPSLLIYATGGAAWLHFESTSSCGLSPVGDCFTTMSPLSITNATTKLGWTLGGGGETRLWSNWFGRAEYRYADYGNVSYVNTVFNAGFGGFGPFIYNDTYSLHMRTHTLNFGLSYKFWDGPRT